MTYDTCTCADMQRNRVRPVEEVRDRQAGHLPQVNEMTHGQL